MNSILLSDAAAGGGYGSILMMVGYIAIFGIAIYFLMIKPQKKEQKRMEALLSTMAAGDSVLTTSGFYGEIIDVSEDDINDPRTVAFEHCSRAVNTVSDSEQIERDSQDMSSW